MKTTGKLPGSFYAENRKKYLTKLDNSSATIFFAGEAPYKTGDDFYIFAPNRNFLYLTGIDCPRVIYFAYKAFGRTEEMLFIERSDKEKERWVGKSLTAEEAAEISEIENIYYVDEFEKTVASIIFTGKITTLYLDMENRFGKHWQFEAFTYYENFKRNYPAVKLKDGGKVVYLLRGVKSEYELEQIKKAISITGVAVEHIINSVAPGMYEYQIESCFDFALKYNGVRERAFDTIIAGGKNATVLHYSANNCEVPENELVLMDFGASWNYYCADISRTIPISGKFTDRQRELYNIVLEGQQKVIDAVKPGITLIELNNILIDYYKSALKDAKLINKKVRGKALEAEVKKYYWHNVSHSLGLDAHDCSPTREMPLEAGVIITVEPGLYIEEEGIGIRIEDDILVTENGCFNLSASIIKTVDEIEKVFEEVKSGAV